MTGQIKEFTESTTADEVAGDLDLTGKLFVITGATAGIGTECARVLAERGADLVLGARRMARLQGLADQFRGNGRIVVKELDLAEIPSVDAFADAVLALERPVDVLINNAGVVTRGLDRTSCGFEMQLAVNYLGHALLASRLLGALRQRPGSRLVSLTSNAHHFGGLDVEDLNFSRRPYNPWVAYGQSKTATSLLAKKFQKSLREAGCDAFAVHPGYIPDTGLTDDLTNEVRLAALPLVANRQLVPSKPKNIEAGAATSLWAALEASLEGRGGIYLENCSIAPAIPEPNFHHGYLPYAVDHALAEALWEKTEQLLERGLPA